MDKFFTKLFWKSLRFLINRSNIVLLIVTALISFLVFKLAELSGQQGTFLALSKASWLSVTASMFAATLFLFLQSFMNLINSAEDNIYRIKYDEFVEKFKLKQIFPQRGSTDILDIYKTLTGNAEKRIWAIGMTNRHFMTQHRENMTKALRDKPIDIIIAFWNPTTSLNSIINGEQKSHNMLDIQYHLEDGAPANSSWEETIKNRQREFRDHIKRNSPIKGELRIVNLSHPTNFTCFVIDDELFFFPFLSGPESTNDPTIQCCINDGVGKRIYDHFARILNGNLIVDTVYHRKADEDIVDRL